MTPSAEVRAALDDGELEVLGRLRAASNATFLCQVSVGDVAVHCVYKPVAGEQPLWDFPDGTLAGRERAAYLVSEHLGWNIVPYTVIRDGPAGPGMVQRWVDDPTDGTDDAPPADLVDVVPAGRVPAGYLSVLDAYDYAGAEVTLIHADDPRLYRMAVFDVLINNADRKGGHILPGADGALYGVDHGVALHVQDKLRTVLWGWAGKPVDEDTLAPVAQLAADLDDGTGELAAALAENITAAEVGALRHRARALLADPVMPSADRHRPIPWPAF
ncbi:SCO1664 family protein [Mycobacterium koreense]|uniref:Phosphatidylinositol kinase n=1 Tax=Mycolicibacillus koreensis TaxID=1069220 RepID=A0A7I7SB17_9MYCO|nr:SCO1664 family protein [Mycolicibacillus koreensis]MCV7249469.1 SCO1664 family protein [Mycolicibacillus koreensis]OSC35172.1 phosphatidylinositol kinase [Mycolicibacillus koreensis]BBY53386.1 phosphatidylinositol kinase [Mycolicibacillus koreensis]